MQLITFDTLDLLIGLSILACLLFALARQGRSPSYLLFFSIFWVYLLVVVSNVIFPIVIDLQHRQASVLSDMNLLPFHFGACSIPLDCAKDVVMNALLAIPFGFGINFLVRLTPRSFLWLAPAVGVVFELSQLIVLLAFQSRFHAIDINDAIFGGLGVLAGYGIFRAFARVYTDLAEQLHLKRRGLLAEVYAVASAARNLERRKSA